MDYHESIAYLESLQRRRPKLGTETTATMLSHLGCPHARIDCVQIAGSNGKGSTARMLESILQGAEVKVGIFTSPSLNNLREQIRVNGQEIPKEHIQSFVNEIAPCIEGLRANDDAPTYFEVLTALSIYHFGLEEVDIAILEVGIGGRYDATSAVDPVASAVTSVSLEHTELLGETVEEIARDKAQVAPSETPLVTGADGAALTAIREETEVITVGDESKDIQACEHGMVSTVENSVSITAPNWEVETNLPLLGDHQATNAGIAATLARQLVAADEDIIESRLRSVHWPGRFEIISTDPLTVLDGSHNPAACAELTNLLDRFEFDNLYVVFGAMEDKDHRKMADKLPSADTVYLSQPNVDRAESSETLASIFDGHANTLKQIDSVLEAAERALSAANKNDCVLVTGSLYVVAEARDRWTRLLIPKEAKNPPAVQSSGTSTDNQLIANSTRHQTVKTQLRKAQATYIIDHLESIGGAGLITNTDTSDKRVSTVLSGTASQFHTLIDRIDSSYLGLSQFSNQLQTSLTPADPTAEYSQANDTLLMGILNVTPDSFYDGGEYTDVEEAIQRARSMIEAGVDIIDVGGESTRPGADPVSAVEEIERIVPVIKQISDLGVPISVDTQKALVADAALEAGADLINDVSGLGDPEMRFVVAEHDASLVIMHSLETPVSPEQDATYDDVVEDVIQNLSQKILLAEQAGIHRNQIIVDPGLGFGKNAAECFELIDRLEELHALGCPVMVGHSRKSMFEHVGCQNDERLSPTLAVTTMAAERSADIVRVHDVPENRAIIQTIKETRAHRGEELTRTSSITGDTL